MSTEKTPHLADLQVVRGVLDGHLEAWHEFVERYSGLILSIARRCCAGFDEDEARNTYVEVLGHFYRDGLRRYDGRATLATFVMTVARRRAIDILRTRLGRLRPPAFLEQASSLDREIYRLYYVDGESDSTIRGRLRQHGKPLSQEEFSAALDRLEARIDARLRSRLAYNLQARSVGAVSGQLIELMDHLCLERERIQETQRPDSLLLEKRTRQLLHQVRSSIQNLDQDSQRVVQLHYYEGLSASEIAAQMSLPGPRRAYSLIYKAIEKLRRQLPAMRQAPVVREHRNAVEKPTSLGDEGRV